MGCLGLLPCFLKIKCTNEVIDNLNFSDLNARLVLVRRGNLVDINFIHKLPENGSVKLLHIGVLSDRSNELPDVDFLLLLFLDFLPKMFDKICKVGLFQLIVTGQFDETLVGELAGNVILIQSLDDNIQLGNPLLRLRQSVFLLCQLLIPFPQALICGPLHKVVLIQRHILNGFPQVSQHDFFKDNAPDRMGRT